MNLRKIISTLALSTVIIAGAQQAKYIFYCIGDGMGIAPVMSALTYKRLALNDSTPLAMTSMPVASMATSFSASSPVTDSAAAGTALATGHKTRNSMLGMDADTVAVTSIAKRLHDQGYGVALVTSVSPDDATPGAFYAHVPARNQYYDIGRQYAESGFEFLGGADLRGAVDKKTGKPTDLLEHMSANGVEVVKGLDGLNKAYSDKIVLLSPAPYNNNELGYVIENADSALSLGKITAAAINHLKRVTPDKFFVMIEGGMIDHALHGNDAGAAIAETLAFDNSVAQALDFYNEHPDETLIIVTADHDTGGISVGNQFVGYDCYPQLLNGQRASKAGFSDICNAMTRSRRTMNWDYMRDVLAESLGLFSVVEVTEEEEKELEDIFEKVFIKGDDDAKESLYMKVNEFADATIALLDKKAGFGFTTGAHTGNPVPVFAIGVGADSLERFVDNTDLPRAIARAAGIEF